MKLAIEQVEHIKRVLDKSNISIDTLRDDLLDHLCCVVEINMEKGGKFEFVLEKAIHELAPEGLEDIQLQTLFLLNSTKIIRMKRVMYFIGLLSAMTFVLSLLFVMMKWPGTRELSIAGFLGFTLIFIPLYAIDYFKVNIQRALSEKLRLSIGILSAFIVATAIIFKLLHLRGADLLLISGTGLFVFGFLPFLFFSLYKKSIS